MASKQIWSITEVAHLIGRTAATLRNWDRDGKLVPDRTEFGDRIYRRHHIDQAIDIARKRKST